MSPRIQTTGEGHGSIVKTVSSFGNGGSRAVQSSPIPTTASLRSRKAGKISFRVDKTGNLHVPVGKASFDEKALRENVLSFVEKVIQLRPSSAKGRYIKSISMSSTMGPGIPVDINDIRALLR